MTTERIDVLAVMDGFANRASYDFPALTVAELREARAAVAELIEANKGMRAAIESAIVDLGRGGANMAGGPGRDAWSDLRMCLTVIDRAALARVGGAS